MRLPSIILGLLAAAVSEASGWFLGLFKRRDDPACAVLELDEPDGRRMWETPSDERPYRRRYFLVSSKEERAEEVRHCAHNNGLPRRDEPHPYTGDRANDIQLRRDEAVGDVWQAMVTYRD